jgi:hypothetical protein
VRKKRGRSEKRIKKNGNNEDCVITQYLLTKTVLQRINRGIVTLLVISSGLRRHLLKKMK